MRSRKSESFVIRLKYTDYNFYSKVIISYGIFEILHYL